MQPHDAKPFREAIEATLELYDKAPFSDAVLRKWWAAFVDWHLDEFCRALSLHEKRSRFAPKPADLFELRQAASGRLSADEAWPLALRGQDEADTVIWTDAIAQAFGVAREVLELGDKIGARMAFRAAYERICSESGTSIHQPVVSLGHDPALRRERIDAALATGLLTQDQAAAYLPAPADAGPLAGLLTGKVVAMPEDRTLRARLQQLRSSIVATPDRTDAERQRNADRQAGFERKREEALRYVAQHEPSAG